MQLRRLLGACAAACVALPVDKSVESKLLKATGDQLKALRDEAGSLKTELAKVKAEASSFDKASDDKKLMTWRLMSFKKEDEELQRKLDSDEAQRRAQGAGDAAEQQRLQRRLLEVFQAANRTEGYLRTRGMEVSMQTDEAEKEEGRLKLQLANASDALADLSSAAAKTEAALRGSLAHHEVSRGSLHHEIEEVMRKNYTGSAAALQSALTNATAMTAGVQKELSAQLHGNEELRGTLRGLASELHAETQTRLAIAAESEAAEAALQRIVAETDRSEGRADGAQPLRVLTARAAHATEALAKLTRRAEAASQEVKELKEFLRRSNATEASEVSAELGRAREEGPRLQQRLSEAQRQLGDLAAEERLQNRSFFSRVSENAELKASLAKEESTADVLRDEIADTTQRLEKDVDEQRSRNGQLKASVEASRSWLR